MKVLKPEQMEKEYKEFHNKMWNCKCEGNLLGERCDKCKELVLDFMDRFGAGILCQDITVENLRKENTILSKENEGLTIQLSKKIKRVEELKEELMQLSHNQNNSQCKKDEDFLGKSSGDTKLTRGRRLRELMPLDVDKR